MPPDEAERRAREIRDWFVGPSGHGTELSDRIAAAIRAAVADETERCAKVAVEYVASHVTLDVGRAIRARRDG